MFGPQLGEGDVANAAALKSLQIVPDAGLQNLVASFTETTVFVAEENDESTYCFVLFHQTCVPRKSGGASGRKAKAARYGQNLCFVGDRRHNGGRQGVYCVGHRPYGNIIWNLQTKKTPPMIAGIRAHV